MQNRVRDASAAGSLLWKYRGEECLLQNPVAPRGPVSRTAISPVDDAIIDPHLDSLVFGESQVRPFEKITDATAPKDLSEYQMSEHDAEVFYQAPAFYASRFQRMIPQNDPRFNSTPLPKIYSC